MRAAGVSACGAKTLAPNSGVRTIVFLDRASIHADFRAPAFPHTWRDYAATDAAQRAAHARDADILVVNKVVLDRATLAELPRLQFIAVCATGTDNIDLEFCRARGVVVSNVRDYAIHTVPEHVMMLLLALRRNLFAYRAALHDGAWERADQFCLWEPPLHELHGSRLGIIGYGALGRATAQCARAFGMTVLVAERRGATAVRAGYIAFDEVLARADAISLHVPLTDETRGLIGARELARMQRHALLINCARGGVVDEAALLAALMHGEIGGAGIDVLREEPPRAGSPLLAARLPNLIVTPHHAWASREAMQTMAAQVIDNIEAFVAGRPRHRVA